jgi:hypothetical protein
VAVADYDRDGWPDLLVTGYGRLLLLHNESDGKGGRRFVDVTPRAGLVGALWGTSAAWGDLDGDGFPDLYVCQYVNWSWDNHPPCPGWGGWPRDICMPRAFAALPHRLYRNNGDGTFAEVGQRAGLRQRHPHDGKGLGALVVDIDGDGRPDVYVANDTEDNFLFLNRSRPGQILLEETALASGVARDDVGAANGSMGVDAADYDGSGRPSIWVTNYEMELHALYRNRGEGQFIYSSRPAGIAALGRHYVGFGTAFLDVENRGWEDLVTANGHVLYHPSYGEPGQRPTLLRNLGTARFREVRQGAGAYFESPHVGRGLAVGDLDNDGRPDLVVSHLNEPVVLLRNEAGDRPAHWLGVELVGKDNRCVAGATLSLKAGGRTLTRFAKGGGSYLSASDRRILFGLGPATGAGRLTVKWPWGRTEYWDGLAPDRYHRLAEGAGVPEGGPASAGRLSAP